MGNEFTLRDGVKIFAGIMALIVFIVIVTSFRIVGPGTRGVKITMGQMNETTLNEGLYWQIPFIQQIRVVDVKTQKAEYQSNSASKDLQSVNTVVAVNYNVKVDTVAKMLKEVNTNAVDALLKPATTEAVKAATAQFTAEELITKRTEVKLKIETTLANSPASKYFDITEVSIVDFSFSPEFDRAIEEKQTAEQQALKEKWNLETIKVQAEQKVEMAKAEAESLRLQKAELTPEMVNLRAIEKWNGQLPTYTGGTIPFVQLNK